MSGEEDRVDLALGSGGLATRRFFQDEIKRRFANESLDEEEDSAFLSWTHKGVVITTDTFLVDPPVFSGGDIGKLAICGTVNDLVASGATPLALTLALVVEEGYSIGALQSVLDSAEGVARQVGALVVCGDTKVVGRGSQIGISLNVTGLGYPHFSGRRFRLSDVRPGDRVILTGTLGNHSIAVLSQREGLGFESRVSSDCAALDSLVLPILDKYEGVRALRDPTRGGLLGALFDLSDSSGSTVKIWSESIRLQKEVAMACEMLGLDAFELVNEGKMVIVVSNEQSKDVLRDLRRHPLGIEASIIGEVLSSRSLGEGVILASGGKDSFLHRPEGPRLPRLC